jgi:hypothetical protein
MVPSTGGRYAIIRLADGRWEIPGGTLEPGEHWRDALRRESARPNIPKKVVELRRDSAYDGTITGITTLLSP